MNETTCPACGAAFPAGAKFCESCGAKVADAAAADFSQQTSQGPQQTNAQPQPAYVQPAQQPNYDNRYKEKYGVTGFWAFFGLIILFGLPGIGFIAAIIFSFAPENKNLKNFARAWVVVQLIGALIWIAAAVALTNFIITLANNLSGFDFEDFFSTLFNDTAFSRIIDSSVGNMPISELEKVIGKDTVDSIVTAINEETGEDYTLEELTDLAAQMVGKTDPTVNDLVALYGGLTGSDVQTLSDLIGVFSSEMPDMDITYSYTVKPAYAY